MSRDLEVADFGKIGVLACRKLITEKTLNPVSPILSGWQANIVQNDEVDNLIEITTTAALIIVWRGNLPDTGENTRLINMKQIIRVQK